MNDEPSDNTNNIISNFKNLSKSISSAQFNIFRCKSTLKCIEEELIYLNVNNNTNTNNKESKKMPMITESPDHTQFPYNMVEIDAEPTKIMDYISRANYPDTLNKTLKTRRAFSKILMSNNSDSNNHLLRNTNVCNISGELNNLMKAQQKLMSQIEQLKCEIREKACAIDTCIKDNQYFSCKFKEVDNDIDKLKKDVDKIKKDISITANRDRGFSPYSQESNHKDVAIHQPLRHISDRLPIAEHHFGYQDVCTPDNSCLGAPTITKSNRNLMLNLRDPQGHSRTFEDLMKKSKLDIDCNINNCRNNQNVYSIPQPVQNSPVLEDFASLTNQIKNLRKMAESIFKENVSGNCKKSNTCNHAVDSRLSKNIDFIEEYSKSSLSKPVVDTTLSMLNQSHLKATAAANPVNISKQDTSSERTSMSGSDTSACFYTEDQLPIHSPVKHADHQISKTKFQEHLNYNKDLSTNSHSKFLEKQKHRSPNKMSNGECCQQKHTRCPSNPKNVKKSDTNFNSNSLSLQYPKSYDTHHVQRRDHIQHKRRICPECNQYLPTVSA